MARLKARTSPGGEVSNHLQMAFVSELSRGSDLNAVGEVSEWPMVFDSKSNVDNTTAGSNPALSSAEKPP